MKKALVAFAVVGGVAVPIVFVLLGFALGRRAPGDATLALLHGVQLPLWPMSKLILDDPSAKHWLYLPLAAVLSNALVYASVGAVSAWGRASRGVFLALLVAVVALLYVAAHGFGSGRTGFVLAAAIGVAGLVMHHRGAAR